MRCPTCGQDNVRSALVCEFCKELLNKKPARAAEPAMAPAAAPRSGFSVVVVALVAVVSAALGFGVRGLFLPAPAAAPVVVAPPPAPVVAAPAPVAVEVEAVAAPEPASAKGAAEPIKPDLQGGGHPAEAAAAPAPAPAAPTAPEAKRITIPYEHLEDFAERIIIPVTINGRGPVKMALDTGAPGTILSLHLATKLGVLREGDTRLLTLAGGIGGTAAASLVILDSIAVGEAKTEFVPATVTDDNLSEAWDGLVGMDFLAGYAISIDTLAHELVLTELPARANTPAGHDEQWWRRTYRQLAGQRSHWKILRARLDEQLAKSDVSAGGDAESLKKLVTFAQQQDREADALASRLDRYASTHSVPLEWRKQ